MSGSYGISYGSFVTDYIQETSIFPSISASTIYGVERSLLRKFTMG